MKKLLIYLAVLVGLFSMFIVINKLNKNEQASKITYNPYGVELSKLNPETVNQLTDPNYHNIILPADLDKRLADKESFFQYFFSSTCSHCKKTTPYLIPIEKQLGLNVPQFNLQEFPDGWAKYKITATPTIVYYKDGVEADRLVGGYGETSEEGITAQEFTDFFKKHSTN